MLGEARSLCTTSGFSWVWTPVRSLVCVRWSVAEHSSDVWGWAGPHMVWLLWPETPLHGALSVHSLLSHKVIFLSLGKFLFPPRRLVSPQACLRRLQPASHTGLSCSAQGFRVYDDHP